MANKIDYSKPLSLHEDCIFVQLDERNPGGQVTKGPLSVVLNTKTGKHWTPQNDSARMILDLLTRNYEGGKKKGVTFDNILVHLKRRYQITQPGQAEEALEVYLDQLKGFGLLQQKTDSDWIDDLDHFENYVPKPGHPGAEKGNIEGGATLICCGSPINWTRP